jgi:hypothetical protein
MFNHINTPLLGGHVLALCHRGGWILSLPTKEVMMEVIDLDT